METTRLRTQPSAKSRQASPQPEQHPGREGRDVLLQNPQLLPAARGNASGKGLETAAGHSGGGGAPVRHWAGRGEGEAAGGEEGAAAWRGLRVPPAAPPLYGGPAAPSPAGAGRSRRRGVSTPAPRAGRSEGRCRKGRGFRFGGRALRGCAAAIGWDECGRRARPLAVGRPRWRA